MARLTLLTDIVAQAAGAELSKVSHVLAKLGGFDAGGAGQGIAGAGAKPIGLEPPQAAQINGQPVNCFPRNFCTNDLFQAAQSKEKAALAQARNPRSEERRVGKEVLS